MRVRLLGTLLLTAVVVAGLVLGVVLGTSGRHTTGTTSGTTSGGTSAPTGTPAAAPAGPLRAVTLRIPSIGVDTRLVGLTVDGAGTLVPPDDPAVAGWYTGSPPPGEMGRTVLAGHVDSHAGPGVFFALRDVAPGAAIEVGRSDGAVLRYRAVAVEAVPKDAFPTADVYGPSPVPELRVITCGGTFDQGARSYRDNVVVAAVPA